MTSRPRLCAKCRDAGPYLRARRHDSPRLARWLRRVEIDLRPWFETSKPLRACQPVDRLRGSGTRKFLLLADFDRAGQAERRPRAVVPPSLRSMASSSSDLFRRHRHPLPSPRLRDQPAPATSSRASWPSSCRSISSARREPLGLAHRHRREEPEIDVHRLEAARPRLALGRDVPAGDVVDQRAERRRRRRRLDVLAARLRRRHAAGDRARSRRSRHSPRRR